MRDNTQRMLDIINDYADYCESLKSKVEELEQKELAWNESSIVIENLALRQRIEELEKWDAIESRENEKLRAKIEQLEAALKCFEHHAYRDIEDQSFANDVIAELGGMPNDRTPIAALQENEL